MDDIKDKNIFLMPYGKEDDLSICAEKLLRDRANSFHVNPFIYFICKKKDIPTSWAEEGQNESGIRWGYGARDSEEFYSYIVVNGKKFELCSEDTKSDIDKVDALTKELQQKLNLK